MVVEVVMNGKVLGQTGVVNERLNHRLLLGSGWTQNVENAVTNEYSGLTVTVFGQNWDSGGSSGA